MGFSCRFEINEPSQIAAARRAATTMAHEIGFNESRAGEVAIVVTEACSNILKHAVRGEILLLVSFQDGARSRPVLEMLALDRGPGMDNLEQCLVDGYTTGTSPGQGLGAIRRLSAESDFYSTPAGTAILARWLGKASSAVCMNDGLRFGCVNVCKRGEDVCGDAWGTEQNADLSTVLVADGLGHGPEARIASLEAVRVLHTNPLLSPGELLDRSHRALRATRGAAVAVARIDHAHRKLSFCGVGNVMAQIYAGSQPMQHLVSVNGTAGHQTSRMREFFYPWPSNGLLIMSSDGLATNTGFQSHPGLAFRDPSLIAGVLFRDFSRGHDDATVIVATAA